MTYVLLTILFYHKSFFPAFHIFLSMTYIFYYKSLNRILAPYTEISLESIFCIKGDKYEENNHSYFGHILTRF
jgi:hypothetical protein